ncbi:hypothetical protein [Marmoricola sp. RAF53]|uniref:hypothetical protein n=1 Tax=Marmoricola sp. RAF53 TaxID=3233059 RepID=UPI003F9A0CC0
MQRAVALVLMLVLGLLSLPVTAYFLDGQGTENWILPVQVAVTGAFGAGVSMLFPGLTRTGSSTRRRLLVGAALGVVTALVGVVIFFLLLNGLGGA